MLRHLSRHDSAYAVGLASVNDISQIFSPAWWLATLSELMASLYTLAVS